MFEMHFQGAQEPLAWPCHRPPGVPSVLSGWQHSQLVTIVIILFWSFPMVSPREDEHNFLFWLTRVSSS